MQKEKVDDMGYMYTTRCSLLVSSSDNYGTTWYPYFELIKRYWKNHPQQIYLNAETVGYEDKELNIISVFGGREATWSERLYRCLERIPTEYVIFSLEDAFLLGEVDDQAIEQCLKWMEADKNIAVCRLKESDNPNLQKSEKYGDFRIAGDDIGFRLETQVALWRREALMQFIDLREDPWQFEGCGTERIKGCGKTFLWFYMEEAETIEKMVYPYHIDQKCGYGVAWGRWLWKNKPWFEKNGISNVKYHVLGVLPEWSVKLRFRFLYRVGRDKATGIEKIVWKMYRQVDRVEKGLIQLRTRGLKAGWKEIRKRM